MCSRVCKQTRLKYTRLNNVWKSPFLFSESIMCQPITVIWGTTRLKGYKYFHKFIGDDPKITRHIDKYTGIIRCGIFLISITSRAKLGAGFQRRGKSNLLFYSLKRKALFGRKNLKDVPFVEYMWRTGWKVAISRKIKSIDTKKLYDKLNFFDELNIELNGQN